MSNQLSWSLDPHNPVIVPGQLNPQWDADHAGAAHVLIHHDQWHMYYWGQADKKYYICKAVAPLDDPNAWRGCGMMLAPQPGTSWNDRGPSFPHVVPVDDKRWLMYVCGWGLPKSSGKLANTTGLAISDDAGASWRYHDQQPVLAMDQPWDKQATGSVWVTRFGDIFRMYYTAIGSYFDKPAGVQTGHGDVLPRIGIGLAESRDGVTWRKPLDRLLIEPRGFETEPYEYIISKPCVIWDENKSHWRMWVCTFGHAYRIRSLTSTDGLDWTWQPSPIDGEMGIGAQGQFDDHQRTYPCVVSYKNRWHCWFTANGFGRTGMGYAHVDLTGSGAF